MDEENDQQCVLKYITFFGTYIEILKEIMYNQIQDNEWGQEEVQNSKK